MTREEQILEAARERAERHQIAEIDKACTHLYSYSRVYNTEIASFEAGVEWADKNPKSPWISVKDDLPCNHKELVLYESHTKPVLVIDHEGAIGIVGMQKRNNGIIGVEPWWQWGIPAVINYWMPIPNFPKE